MTRLNLRSIILLAFTLRLSSIVLAEDRETKSICSWRTAITNTKCNRDQFQCVNSEGCIPKSYYCDGGNDCSDGSDERYCGRSNLALRPDRYNLERIFMSNTAQENVLRWLYNNKTESSFEKWGNSVDKLALIMFLAEHNFNTSQENKNIAKEFAYELSIQLLLRLTRMQLKNIPSVELASYLNAFLVMCVNPRSFNGYDIIQELRNIVDQETYTNPYVILALCNAGETITESDKNKLIDTFDSKHRIFWTDVQAVAVMALACASKQPGNVIDSDTLNEMTLELKQQQYRNGTVVNLSTTALVMQALISTDSERDPDNFDEMKAFDELLRNQKSDGSFGDLMTTFLVVPVLLCRSLADINANHCHYGIRDETSALENLSRRSGHKIRVQYSLWIGNDKDLERNLILRVPQNMSLYGIMETAAEIDSRFKFEYSVSDRKPYISAISGMRDNPLTGHFWFLYTIQNGAPTFSNESTADVIPEDNSHYVMWYRRGTWVG